MNYYAHGLAYVSAPYFLAGTAVPDWLSVVNRRVRVRPKQVALHVADPDPCLAALARGIARHHDDDGWFHQTRAFAELSLQFTRDIRRLCAGDESLRPFFLGHILIELLLDAILIARDPERLRCYYAAFGDVDPHRVERAVSQLSGRDASGVARFIAIFQTEQFLWDYLADDKLQFRLNQVLRRVRLPALPEILADWFPAARAAVAERMDELLTPNSTNTPITFEQRAELP